MQAKPDRYRQSLERFKKVSAERERSKAASTRKFASSPHRFVQCAHRETSSVIVPTVSSERRAYIPMGFLDNGTVISNAGQRNLWSRALAVRADPVAHAHGVGPGGGGTSEIGLRVLGGLGLQHFSGAAD